MPMLRRGYGAVKNLRCKSGARFPPSTDWILGENIQMRRIRDRLDVLGKNIQMRARAMAVA